MSDLRQAIELKMGDAEWEDMARVAGEDTTALKEKIIVALEQYDKGEGIVERKGVRLSEAPPSEVKKGCQSQRYAFDIWGVVGISGTLTLCGSDMNDWYADMRLCLVVASSEVWCTTYRFDNTHLEVCVNPNVGVAKANICAGISQNGTRLCLHLSGSGCYWIFGWRCGDFDVTPVCLRLEI